MRFPTWEGVDENGGVVKVCYAVSMGLETCKEDDCDRQVKARGWCFAHYQRWYRNYAETGAVRKRNPRGSWWRDKDGYMVRRVRRDGKLVLVRQHREVMEEHLGRKLLPHETPHHVNGDRTDNRIDNLELWSTSQPGGQRVSDKLAWAHEMIRLYENG